MICPVTNNQCRTNGCGPKCYKRDTLDSSTLTQPREKTSKIWVVMSGDFYGDEYIIAPFTREDWAVEHAQAIVDEHNAQQKYKKNKYVKSKKGNYWGYRSTYILIREMELDPGKS